MPPKPKFGKAEIINAGLTIAKNEGLDQVTARSIAKTLGTSQKRNSCCRKSRI